jgi:hypothetical protein
MPNSRFGVAVSEGLRRSARERDCPECGRGAALVEVVEPERRGLVCRWARDSDGRLCSWKGAFIPRR